MPMRLKMLSGLHPSSQVTTSINVSRISSAGLRAAAIQRLRIDVRQLLRIGYLLALLLGCLSVSWAQKRNVVTWEMTPDPAKAAPGGPFRLKLTAKIDPEWHMYSLTTPKGGGLPAVITLGSAKVYQP